MILDGSSAHQTKFSWNIFTDVFDLRSLGSITWIIVKDQTLCLEIVVVTFYLSITNRPIFPRHFRYYIMQYFNSRLQFTTARPANNPRNETNAWNWS